MKELIDKLVQVEKDISSDKGSFLLFALFLREDAPDLWDLLIAAKWVEENKANSLKYLSSQLTKHLKQDELIKLSRILIIESNNPGLKAIHRAIQIEHGKAEIRGSNFFGLQIKHAYLITSKRGKAPNKANSADTKKPHG
jgi:hypothetical protein